VNAAVERVLQQTKSEVPRGARVQVQGQAVTMKSAYVQLLIGSRSPSCSCTW